MTLNEETKVNMASAPTVPDAEEEEERSQHRGI